jgi:transcriptional regulator GlxA family with amidase domain
MNSITENIQLQRGHFISTVMHIMEQNLHDEDFHVRQVWRELGMSRAQFYRKCCRTKYGNPAACLLKLRLEKASSLLIQTELNVSEIAYEVGFKNASHFTRIFSQHLGEAPGCFRKKQMRQIEKDLRQIEKSE